MRIEAQNLQNVISNSNNLKGQNCCAIYKQTLFGNDLVKPGTDVEGKEDVKKLRELRRIEHFGIGRLIKLILKLMRKKDKRKDFDICDGVKVITKFQILTKILISKSFLTVNAFYYYNIERMMFI